jgi:hypothetical protein
LVSLLRAECVCPHAHKMRFMAQKVQHQFALATIAS